MSEFLPDEYDQDSPEVQEFIEQAIVDLDNGEPVRIFIGGIVTNPELREDIERLRSLGVDVIIPSDS